MPAIAPLNQLVSSFEQQADQVFQQIQSQLLALLQKPELAGVLNRVTQLLQGDFVQNIKNILARLINKLLANSSPLAAVQARQETEQQLRSELSKLKLNLTEIILNLIDSHENYDELNLKFNEFLRTIDPFLNNFANLVDAASALFNSMFGKRDLGDFIMNILGLGQVWETIQALGQNFVGQIQQIASQFLFASGQVKDKILQIFNQLRDDLFNHVGDATTIVSNAIASINSILQNKPLGKRDLLDLVFNVFGLSEVFQTIQSVGQQLKDSFFFILEQLLFQGQQVLANARAILAQLVQDLKEHADNAVPLVQGAIAQLQALLSRPSGNINKRDLQQFVLNSLGLGAVIDNLRDLTGQAIAQLVLAGLNLIQAGRDKLDQAKQILAALIDDLRNHVLNSQQFVQQAVQAINNVLKPQ